jgi:transcriptional regulator with XRE-family HTH domain
MQCKNREVLQRLTDSGDRLAVKVHEALGQLRVQAGLSTRELADRLGWSQARVSRVERGETRATAEIVREWAEATGASPAMRAELEEQAGAAAYTVRSWKTVHSAGLAASQRDIARVEAQMTGLQNFEQLEIPGLLQTAGYAQRVLQIADVSGQGNIGEAVSARMRRQQILYEPDRTFEFVLTQAALRPYFPLSPELARGQAEHLVSVMTLPSVSVAVIPATAQHSEPYLSSFMIFHVPGQPVVLVEILAAELLLGADQDVALYQQSFARLRDSAVTGDAAARLIRETLTH